MNKLILILGMLLLKAKANEEKYSAMLSGDEYHYRVDKKRLKHQKEIKLDNLPLSLKQVKSIADKEVSRILNVENIDINSFEIKWNGANSVNFFSKTQLYWVVDYSFFDGNVSYNIQIPVFVDGTVPPRIKN